MKTRRLFGIAVFFILLIVFCSTFITCNLFGAKDEPQDETGDEGESGKLFFSWSSPDLPEESIFTMGTVEDRTRGRRTALSSSRWTASSESVDGPNEIEPDSFRAAYSYIGIVPDTIVHQMGDIGFQANRRDEAWVGNDEYLKLDDPSRIPGYFGNWHPSTGTWDTTPIFEAYVDESSPVTKTAVKAEAFTLYDSAEHDDLLKVFDVSSGTTTIELEELPEDLSVEYLGVASELIYYETVLNGYGSMRFFFNDHPAETDPEKQWKAGDVLVKKTGETGWKWAYLQHGDGPDADCFTYTSNDVTYDDVKQPDDPEVPFVDWSWQPYDGKIDTYEGAGPWNTYLYDSDLKDFCDGSSTELPQNCSKRPSGSGSYSYLMADREVMYGNPVQDIQFSEFTAPKLDLAGGIGGYKVFGSRESHDPADNQAFGTYVSGYYEDGDSFSVEPEKAFIVYHEPDYHLGTEDLTKIAYLDNRLDDSKLLTRKELVRNYGWYAWDSGLYSNLYDDAPIAYGRGGSGGTGGGSDPMNPFEYSDELILNPLHFATGRMHVYADALPETGDGPVYSDNWFDRIISMEIELQLDANLRYSTDALDKTYGVDGANVASDDVEKRFLTFIPDWIEVEEKPTSPTPKPYSFNGADDIIQPPITFTVIPDRFKIRHEYIHYQDAYTLPPQCSPDPADGPFDGDIELSLEAPINAEKEEVVIFYTLDGSDPVVNENKDRSEVSAASISTEEYTGPITITRVDTPVTVKAVAYQQKSWESDARKNRSIVKEAVYIFKEPGTEVSFLIKNSSLPDETPIFAGLFADATLDLNTELNPLYSAFGTLSEGQTELIVPNVPSGTYYAAVFADADKSGSMSWGDQIYPKQSDSPAKTNTLEGTSISVPTSSSITVVDSNWSEY